MNGHKGGTSLVWDLAGKYREQTWTEFKTRLAETHGGLGVAAADFAEMLEYKSAPFHEKAWTLRKAYSELTAGAVTDEDFDVLARICDSMLTDDRQLEAAWAIVRLRDGEDKLDCRRAGAILSRVFTRNGFHGRLLARTLNGFVESYEPLVKSLESLRQAGVLSEVVVRAINSPYVFLAYARDDGQPVLSIRDLLVSAGCVAWLDCRELVAGDEWESKLRDALKRAEFFVPCVSKATQSRKRYFHEEVRLALERRNAQSGFPLIIPIRLDDVPMEEELVAFHCIDFFGGAEQACDRLAKDIQRQFQTIGAP